MILWGIAMQILLTRRSGTVGARRIISVCIICVIVLSTCAGVVLTTPVVVYAISAGGIKSTIASIIISLLLQTGVAPTNTQWLNTLNNSYSITIEESISQGLLTETAEGLVDSGLANYISNASAYTDLGLSDIFTTTATDVGVTAATGAVNIANTAINVGTVGTIGAFAGAAAVGVGIGVLINNVREKFTSLIKYGLPLSTEEIKDMSNNLPAGYGNCYYSIRRNGGTYYTSMFFVNSSVRCVGYITNNQNNAFVSRLYNNSGITNASRYIREYRNSTIYNEVESIANTGPSVGGSPNVLIDTNIKIFSDENSMNNFINNEKSDNPFVNDNKAPDLIGKYGNQFIDSQDGQDILPGITNVVPDGSDMRPVNPDDYQRFVDNANGNTEDGNYTDNGQLFDNLVNPLLTVPSPAPDVNPYPDSDRPVVPTQPATPEKPEITPADQEEALGMMTPDLRDIFPFCIPFDIYNIFRIFKTENRKAPYLVVPVDNSGNTITIDMSMYDDEAGLLRVLELIAFIIGLAVATRKLIGAGGGG